jgi:hypothetical protein
MIGGGRGWLAELAMLGSRQLTERRANVCLLLGAVLLFGCAHALLVPNHWLVALGAYLGSGALLVLRESRGGSLGECAPPSRRAGLAAAAVVGVVAVFYRTRYLDTVPIGFPDEVLGQFLAFSDRLLREGLIYLPVYGYASTLHAYLAALMWRLFGATFHVFRVYLAALGVASCLAMYWWLKRLFGVREAVIGGILLASSPWHQWATRWGYHTALTPLFTMLFCAALFALTKSSHKARWAVVVALLFALGVHGHWGFALEAVAGVLFLGYVAITGRGFLREHARALTLMVASGALLLAPFAVYFFGEAARSSYMRGRLAADAVASSMSQLEKYAYNLKQCYCQYSASPEARALAEHSGGISTAMAVAGGCGLLLCLVKARRSSAHAMMVLFYLVNLAGLTITSALHIYATYLLVFWIGAAAVLGVEAWRAVEALVSRRASKIAVAVACGVVLAAAAARDYRHYFGTYLYDVHGEPGWTGTYLLEKMRTAPRRGDVYLPRNEPEIDFNDAVLSLGGIGDYTFVRDADTVHADTLFFPRSAGAGRAAEVFLPAQPFWTSVFIPRLRAIYPHLDVHEIPFPRPWRAAGRPLMLVIEVPAGDISASRRLRVARAGHEETDPRKSPGVDSAATGYFLCDTPGAYLFSSRPKAVITVGGGPADGPVLLTQGAVAVQVRWRGEEEPNLSVQRVGAGRELADHLFHVPPGAEDVIDPCVAPRGVTARIMFAPDRSKRLEQFDHHRIQDALEVAGRLVCTWHGEALLVVPRNADGYRSYPLKASGTYRIGVAPDGRVWAYAPGGDRLYVFDLSGSPASVTLEGAGSISGVGFDSGGDLFAVCRNEVRIYKAGRWEAPVRVLAPLWSAASPASSPLSSAVAPDGRIAVIDAMRRELTVLGPEGVHRRQLSGIWPGACVFFAGANWFVRVWPETLLVFDRELRPIVPPSGDTSGGAWWSTDPTLSLSESLAFHATAEGGFSFFRLGEFVTMRPRS